MPRNLGRGASELVPKRTVADFQDLILRTQLRHPSVVHRIWTVSLFVLRRTKWLLSTIPALYQFGSAARSESGIGHVDQFLQLLQITAKFGHTSEDYYRYRMYRDITTARSFLPLGLRDRKSVV